MSRRKIKAGSTSNLIPIFIQDTSSTTGAGLGSLVYNSSGLAAKYRRDGAGSWTAITLATATAGTWASGGFIADGGSVTGGYEIGLPDAACAASAKWVQIQIYGATNMLPVLIEIELDAVDYQDAVAFGLSMVPVDIRKALGTAVTLDANNVLNVSTKYVSGTLQTAGDIYGYLTTNLGALGANLSAIPKTGFKLASDGLAAVTAWTVAITGNITGNLSGSIGSYTGNTPQTGDAFLRLGAPAGASTAADIAAIKSETDTILTDVNTGGGAIYTRLGAPAGASIAADIAAVNSKTTNLPAAPASTTNITAGTITTVTNLTNAPTAGDLTATMKASVTAAVPTTAQIFAAVLTSQLTEAYSADGVAPTLAQAIFLIQQALTDFSISGTTSTIHKIDGSTTAATLTLNSATTPTAVTRAT